jgi:hypothetical protein
MDGRRARRELKANDDQNEVWVPLEEFRFAVLLNSIPTLRVL